MLELELELRLGLRLGLRSGLGSPVAVVGGDHHHDVGVARGHAAEVEHNLLVVTLGVRG